jgi:hypothetical protein
LESNKQKVYYITIILAALIIGIIIACFVLQDNSIPDSIIQNKKFQLNFLFNAGDTTGDGKLNKPLAVDVSDNGQIFVADSGNSAVKVFDAKGKYLFKMNLPAKAKDNRPKPSGVAINQNLVYVTDMENGRVQLYHTTGKFIKTIIDSKADTKLQQIRPMGIDISLQGDIYLTDIALHRIMVYDNSGKFKFHFGQKGSENGSFLFPNDITLGTDNTVLVSDSNNARIQVFDAKGIFKYIIGTPTKKTSLFTLPRGLDIDEKNRLFIADTLVHTLIVLNKPSDTSTIISEFSQQGDKDKSLLFPNGLAVKNNKIYITNRDKDQITVLAY